MAQKQAKKFRRLMRKNRKNICMSYVGDLKCLPFFDKLKFCYLLLIAK